MSTPCLVIFSTLLFQIVSLPFGSLQSSLKSSSRLHFKIFGSNLLDAISREISASVGEKFSAILFRDNAGGGGGGGARVGSVVDKFQQEYFVKSGKRCLLVLLFLKVSLQAERISLCLYVRTCIVNAMHESRSVNAPKVPVCYLAF